ncbi:MAG: hypothetical protein K9I69_07170, partial [Ignavibacteriales bacterium]|nr:hypothetical protein [Ignavibacteriales bacterium]
KGCVLSGVEGRCPERNPKGGALSGVEGRITQRPDDISSIDSSLWIYFLYQRCRRHRMFIGM